MLGALRRCPASLSKTLSSAAFAYRSLRIPVFQPSSTLRIPTSRSNGVAIAAFHQSAKWRRVAAAEYQTEQATQDGPITEFTDLSQRGLVHPNIINVITKQMRLQTMTDVQSRTINEALSGTDVIAQAKTGTGKTLGFLIPIIQRIIQKDPTLSERARGYKRAKSDDIRAIIISPTRELAEQIAVEARKVTSNTGVVVQVAVGGTQKREMLQKTRREGCHLLIGTPGRLNDIFSDPYSGVKAPNLNALVMDEADRLLDDGFQKEIEQIKKSLPDPEEVDRQTLMFSATVPRDVVDLVRRTLKPGFHFANCVSEDEEPTHQRVPQNVVYLSGFENIMPALYELILRELQQAKAGNTRPFKAIIYFNSTAEVTLAASVFFKLAGGFKRDKPLHGLRAYEIHAKLSQGARTRASDSFRFADSSVLFSSDVTARGMDFPNVTHVIQVGLPRERDSYIHRLGRTGRAGKEGQGWLLLAPIDRYEMRRRLPGLPLKEDQSLETAAVDMSEQGEVPENVAKMLQEVAEVHKRVYPDQLDNAFRGLFGAYQWYSDKRGLLEAANRLAEFGWGMPTPPQPPASLYHNGSRSGQRGSRSSFGGSRGGPRQQGSGGTMFDGRGSGRYSNDRGSQRGGGFSGGRNDRGGFSGGRNDNGGGFGGRTERGGGYGGRTERGGDYGGRTERGGGYGGGKDRSSNFDF